MFVVVEKNYYGYEDGGCSLGEIYGPFSSREKADSFAKTMNAKQHYAVEFNVHSIDTSEAN